MPHYPTEGSFDEKIQRSILQSTLLIVKSEDKKLICLYSGNVAFKLNLLHLLLP